MNIKQLALKYPELFVDCFDFSVGLGWLPIVDTLCSMIRRNNEQHPNRKPVVFHQIKEKFGNLRIYTNIVINEVDEWIKFAENLSYNVCEYCGKYSDVCLTGWIKNYCTYCAELSGKPFQKKDE